MLLDEKQRNGKMELKNITQPPGQWHVIILVHRLP